MNRKSIHGKTYRKLMHYLVKKCDTLYFSIPHPNQNCIIQSAYKIDDPQGDFEKYLEQIQDDLKQLTKHTLKISEEFGTVTTQSTGVFTNYTVALKEDLLPVLLSKDDLNDWVYPYAPSDLCFFQGDKPFLTTIAHENMQYFNINDKAGMLELKREVGIKLRLPRERS